MRYLMESKHVKLDYTPETSALTVTVTGSEQTWSWANQPFLGLPDKGLSFADARCESFEYNTGVSRGVRAVYSDFKDGAGNTYPYTVETCLSIDITTGDVKAEARVDGDGMGELLSLAYPPRVKFDVPEGHGYTVLPRMQGALIPAGHPEKMNGD